MMGSLGCVGEMKCIVMKPQPWADVDFLHDVLAFDMYINKKLNKTKGKLYTWNFDTMVPHYHSSMIPC